MNVMEAASDRSRQQRLEFFPFYFPDGKGIIFSLTSNESAK
jgi:hypothetical protein